MQYNKYNVCCSAARFPIDPRTFITLRVPEQGKCATISIRINVQRNVCLYFCTLKSAGSFGYFHKHLFDEKNIFCAFISKCLWFHHYRMEYNSKTIRPIRQNWLSNYVAIPLWITSWAFNFFGPHNMNFSNFFTKFHIDSNCLKRKKNRKTIKVKEREKERPDLI